MASVQGTPMPANDQPNSPHRIAMVSDFFFPRLGGVEMHIWSLSQCLLRQGHKVIIITHAYGQRTGVRYMTNGLKVYYLPWITFAQENSTPTLYPLFPLLRDIILRERIQTVHGHQATSSFMHECLMHACTMGLGTCYTDHSLFSFNDLAGIFLNKVMKFTLSGVDRCIAVSHCDRENLVLRASLHPDRVTAIPNAADMECFVPDPSARPARPTINVVVISRLAYRKGIDLLAHMIPLACERFPNLNFIIGGDGPKRLLLDEMREQYQLHDRVELLGAVEHNQVRDVLCRGTIFVNCSLTESFCIAILEAASCGLLVVSTRVGGVPEVLPPDMISFAGAPTPEALLDALAVALNRVDEIDPLEFHERVKHMYSWRDVATKTAQVYDSIRSREAVPWYERVLQYYRLGPLAGLLAFAVVSLDVVFYMFLMWWRPANGVEHAMDLELKHLGVSQNEVNIHAGRTSEIG